MRQKKIFLNKLVKASLKRQHLQVLRNGFYFLCRNCLLVADYPIVIDLLSKNII